MNIMAISSLSQTQLQVTCTSQTTSSLKCNLLSKMDSVDRHFVCL